jgi:hypothetical protein
MRTDRIGTFCEKCRNAYCVCNTKITYNEITEDDLMAIIRDVFDEHKAKKPEREFVIYTTDIRIVEEFHEAMKSAVERMYPTFEIGDTIEIVNFGHPMWFSKSSEDWPYFKNIAKKLKILDETEEVVWCDINPSLVGRQAIITGLSSDGKRYSTSIVSWLSEKQMKLIKKGNNDKN